MAVTSRGLWSAVAILLVVGTVLADKSGGHHDHHHDHHHDEHHHGHGHHGHHPDPLDPNSLPPPPPVPSRIVKKEALPQVFNEAPLVTSKSESTETSESSGLGKGKVFKKKLPVKLGSDGRPLLFAPKIEMCQKRSSHGKLGNHHYFLSWREPWHKFEDWDWFNGRNFCRERCMDLVSFETPTEFKMFQEVMAADNITSIYTSGRKCNFQGKGCDAARFQPINVNGWFWAGAGNARLPSTNQPDENTFWSSTGPLGKPQPDNSDGLKAGKLRNVADPVGLTVEGLQEWHDEACLAVLNNHYNDGVTWHDVSCHMRSKIVCEDSDELLQRALNENPGQKIAEPAPQKS